MKADLRSFAFCMSKDDVEALIAALKHMKLCLGKTRQEEELRIALSDFLGMWDES